MSYELDYFPPQGTKYQWGSKALTYSPWYVEIWSHWPASIVAKVDKIDGEFVWRVEVRDFKHKLEVIRGVSGTDLAACKAAEKCAEKQKKKIWRPWMIRAVAAGWRPPP